jgi:hypothetical protein
VLFLQFAVVRQPAECDLAEGDIVLARNLLDSRKRFEVGLVPVPVAVILRKCKLGISDTIKVKWEGIRDPGSFRGRSESQLQACRP